MRRKKETDEATGIRVIAGQEFLEEAAATRYLGYRNRLTLYRRRKHSGLPYYKHGQSVLYKKSDLDSFVEKRRITLAA